MQEKELSKRQKQAVQTRQSLLDAGRTVFLEKGFQKATMTQINKLAKTGYGTAYLYFRNKDDLFIELMESIMQKMYKVKDLSFRPESRQQAFKQINRQIQQFLEAAWEEKEMMIVVQEGIGVSTAVKEKWDQIRSLFITGIEKDIIYVQEKNLAKKDLQASIIARGWFYMNEQMMWDLIRGEVQEEIDEISHHLTRLYTGGLYH